jgi:hypothetical protein
MGTRRSKQPARRGEATPAPSRPHRRVTWRIATLVGGIAIATAALAFFLTPARGLITSDSSPDIARAAILDQLYLTFPNDEFISAASQRLESAGYDVDVFQGREVTVELYRNLPKQGYEVVILRVHSGLVEEIDPSSGSETLTDYVSLFTGESFTPTRYIQEVEDGPIGVASSYEGGPEYFGVGPTFIESSMNGDFDDTLVILMGCDGLRSSRTAEAFLARGADSFVSWDQPVSAEHTDLATLHLLEHLYEDSMTVANAVERTMADVGPDPVFDAKLLTYPTSAADEGG